MNKKPTLGLLTMLLISIGALSAFGATYVDSSTSVISLTLVNQEPAPAIAGETAEIRIGLENIGGGIADTLVLELEPSYPFETIAGEEYVKVVGSLGTYQSGDDMTLLKYKIKISNTAIAGTYDLKLTYYTQGQKDTSSITRTVSIDVSGKESAEIMQIDKTILIPGKQSSLKFTITNVGNSPLRDIVFSWSNDDNTILPVGSDNRKYIKYLEIGKSTDVEYQVIADSEADAGLYALNLNLEYSDVTTGAISEISTLAGMYVGGPTDFDVAFSEISSGQTSFTIANTGSNPAYSVSIIIPSQNKWTATGANSMIIGNLNKGDYTVASFTLKSSNTMPALLPLETKTTNSNSVSKPSTNQTNINSELNTLNTNTTQTLTPNINPNTNNNLIVQIDYTDTMGLRQSVNKSVSMNQQSSTNSTIGPGGAQFNLTSNQSFFSKYKWYFLIIFVVVAGLIFFKIYKNKQSKKK
ncbi:MAG: COG1361 S-layer family protein [Candidatus Woesearchaeota archaeon]|jgi:hypothetical protein